MRVGVVSYPGACDDRDAMHAVALMGAEPARLWHADPDLGGVDAVIIPGGFSYGDYLRPGALAALSPVMGGVRAHAAAGRPVLGICNGFQVLTEAGLVPGVLRPNASLRFRCHDVALAVEHESPWLPGCCEGDQLTIPIKQVAALMPPPVHAVEHLVGSTDGRILLQGLLDLAGVAAPA